MLFIYKGKKSNFRVERPDSKVHLMSEESVVTGHRAAGRSERTQPQARVEEATDKPNLWPCDRIPGLSSQNHESQGGTKSWQLDAAQYLDWVFVVERTL